MKLVRIVSGYTLKVSVLFMVTETKKTKLFIKEYFHHEIKRLLSLSQQLFTVVQHVKHFNDVVEFGENQEFTDDFEYLATGLKTGQPLNTRCLRCRKIPSVYILTILQYLKYGLMFVFATDSVFSHYNSVAFVCSVISLATRCAMPSFRMHLRARGKVAQVFKTLNDAPQLPVSQKMFGLFRNRHCQMSYV